MQEMRWATGLGAVAMAMVLSGVGTAGAAVTSDRPAAILQYPDVSVQASATGFKDTFIQISNTSSTSVLVSCYYENANAHCSDTGEVCEPNDPPAGCGTCDPGWNEIDFRLRLTPFQPLGWLASEGLEDFPLAGNDGSRVPAVPETPFTGSLKCVAIDDTGSPLDQNVLKGEASIGYVSENANNSFDVAKYNAVGLRAIAGAVNDDNVLVLGGPEPEYDGCPNVLILNHLFDLVVAPVTETSAETYLVLVPCTQDLLRQIPGTAVVQYLVFNEFEQRFSTSRSVNCQQAIPISEIDTTQPDRSIFSAGVAGTVVGQTRLTPIGSGLVGVAYETQGSSSAAFNIHFQGERAAADLITVP